MSMNHNCDGDVDSFGRRVVSLKDLNFLVEKSMALTSPYESVRNCVSGKKAVAPSTQCWRNIDKQLKNMTDWTLIQKCRIFHHFPTEEIVNR